MPTGFWPTSSAAFRMVAIGIWIRSPNDRPNASMATLLLLGRIQASQDLGQDGRLLGPRVAEQPLRTDPESGKDFAVPLAVFRLHLAVLALLVQAQQGDRFFDFIYDPVLGKPGLLVKPAF